MILKILCTIAFAAPDGRYKTGYEFDLRKYTLTYSTADLAFTIENDKYSLRASTGVCTLATFRRR